MNRIVINPLYSKLKDFIENIHENFDNSGVSIYKGRNEIKTFEIDDLKLNVKSFKVPHFINKVAYAWLRGSKAKHSFQYATKIRACGAETPEPVACVEVLKRGLFDRSYYVSIHHQYDFTIRDLIGFDFPDKENILRQFAIFTHEKMHQNGIHHLDYSRGNVLISKRENQQYGFSVVDINRMRFENMNYLSGLKNFAQLWASDDELEIIAREYAKINNRDENEATRLLVEFDKKHKAKIEKKLAWKRRIKGAQK